MSASSVLVIFRKQLGDLLMLQPALEAMSHRFERVSVDARPGFADLIGLMPGNIRLAEPAAFPRNTEVYCLEPRAASMLRAARNIGARRHLLLTRNRAPWWHRLIFDDYVVMPGGETYRAQLFYRMLTGDHKTCSSPRLEMPPADWLPPGLPADYTVLHPTAAWRRKSWPAEKWVEVLRALDPQRTWVLTGGGETWEMAMAEEIAGGLQDRTVINLVGKTTLKEYLAVLAGTAATLCIDGSASHISSAFRRPTLTLFGATSAHRWHRPDDLALCLKADDFAAGSKPTVGAIPVEAVLMAARRTLGETA